MSEDKFNADWLAWSEGRNYAEALELLKNSGHDETTAHQLMFVMFQYGWMAATYGVTEELKGNVPVT